jgi:DNA end-binding protein Ku
MARSIWTGSLSFGLVNVPVSVVPAVQDLDLHFRQLHRKDGAPIEVQRWCSKENVEVPYEEVTHGYELDDDEQVIVSDLELEAIAPRRTRTIEIEQFVELSEVDPIYFDHPYFLLPAAEDDGTRRAYRLLSEVMGRTERAALGRFVMRAKEYLAIVRSRDGVLTLTTMLFADEIRSRKGIDTAGQKSSAPARKEIDAAVAVIEELSCEWEPGKHKDRYRARLKRVVDQKRKGETVRVSSEREQPTAGGDLMEALERTLEQIGGNGGKGRTRRKSARGKRKKESVG